MDTYKPELYGDLQQDYQKLESDKGSASAQVITQDIVKYYTDQDSVRSYTAEAAEVAGDTSINGMVANQNVMNFLGPDSAGTLLSIKEQLAEADWDYISTHGGQIPTLYQDAREHIQVFSSVTPTVPIIYWSGTPFAEANVDWLFNPKPAEIGPDQHPLFQNLTSAQLAQAFGNVTVADLQVLGQIGALPSLDDAAAISAFPASLLYFGIVSAAAITTAFGLSGLEEQTEDLVLAGEYISKVVASNTLPAWLSTNKNVDGSTTYTIRINSLLSSLVYPIGIPSLNYLKISFTVGNYGVKFSGVQFADGSTESQSYAANTPEDTTLYNVDGGIVEQTEALADGGSSITTVSQTTGVASTTDYTEADGQGTGLLSTLKVQVAAGDTYASIASRLGFGAFGGVALAVMNGSLDMSETPQSSEIYVPQAASAPTSLTVQAPNPSGENTESASQSWFFPGGGILVLDTSDASFTPLTVSGASNPGNNVIYVVNAAGQLIDTLNDFGGAQITLTITDTPASRDEPASTEVTFDVLALSSEVDATYSVTTEPGADGQAEFTPAMSQYGLPFFDTSTGSSSAGLHIATTFGDGQLATFDTSDSLPDGHWTIGVDEAGDAVFTGDTSTGFVSTVILTQGEGGDPLITSVALGQVVYALDVIEQGASTVGAGPQPTIVAEGGGTTTATLESSGPIYWHVNGSNDTIDLGLGSGFADLYMTEAYDEYKVTWNQEGTLSITGGSTGTLTVKVDGEYGEISFADGTVLGLGSNFVNGIEADTEYGGGPSNSVFELDGGDQSIYGADNDGNVIFDAGSNDPADWNISQTSDGSGTTQVVFDGTDADYDGIATLAGVSLVSLNGTYYTLQSVQQGSPATVASATDPTIVTDTGNADLTFDSGLTAYWFVGGGSDTAVLEPTTVYYDGRTAAVEVFFSDAEDQYVFGYSPSGALAVTGGVTGTTTFDVVPGATAELNFSDGAVVGLGDAGDSVEFGGPGNDTFNLSGGDTYTNGGLGSNSVNLTGSTYQYNVGLNLGISEDSQGDVVLNAASSGYDGTATLANIQTVYIAYAPYNLLALPQAGDGVVTIGSDSGFGTLIAEAGGDNVVTVDTPSYGYSTAYWHVGLDDTVVLESGRSDLYMLGTEAEYSIAYGPNGLMTLGDSVPDRNGTTSLVVGAGTANIFFADGASLGVGSGEQDLSGGSLTVSDPPTLAGTTLFTLRNAAILQFSGAVEPSETIDFQSQDDTVQIDYSSIFGVNVGTDTYAGPLIQDFEQGDAVDLEDLSYLPGSMSLNYDVDTGVLQVSNGIGDASLYFGAGDAVVDDPFHLSPDATGGTLVMNDTPACYVLGTLILTDRGQVSVECLAIGDRVITVGGETESIVWIGWRRYSGRSLTAQPAAQPIRFQAGSLGGGLPRRDLLVSPEHCMYLDGFLIPARCLVNGSTVVWERGLADVSYFHIELSRHTLILAEGAPSETFRDDDDSRRVFRNAAQHSRLYARQPAAGLFCAPRVDSGFQLELIRNRLQRARHSVEHVAAG